MMEDEKILDIGPLEEYLAKYPGYKGEERVDVDAMWMALERRRDASCVRGRMVSQGHWGAMDGRTHEVSLRLSYNPIYYLGISLAIIISVFGIKQIHQNTIQPSKSYSTALGQQARITLSDGSTVQLAPDSKLTTSFTSENREVALIGEALFTVSSNNNVPFIVRTGNTTTRVLGTSFGVRRYENDPTVRVAVAAGKVSLNNTILTLGDIGETTPSGDVRVQHESNLTEVLGWTSGRLAIRDLPLHEAAPILERWYGLQLRFGDAELKNLKLTSTISTTARPEAVIGVLRTLGLRIEQNGTIITLYSNQ